MKAPQWVGVSLLCVSLSAPALGQSRPGGGRGSGGGSFPSATGMPTSPGIGATTHPSTFISGKVVLDDGTPLTESAAIETICRGNRHTVAYTDSHGSFSFQFGDPTLSATADLSDASNNMLTLAENRQQQRGWTECEIQAVLAGFTSEVVELASRMNTLESGEIGSVTLHRMAQVEGSSISVTSALAPGGAKKAFEKARQAEKKGQWDKAQQSLEKAVHIYPKYASAWFELGRVQMQKHDLVSAKQSFQRSVGADPKYVNPYDGLAQLAFQSQQWPDVVDNTNKLLSLDPVDFPMAYFLNGIANYYLRNLDAAEKTVRQGTKVDEAHRVPKLQYLLGMILLQKHDYQGASTSLKQYIQLTKQPAEIAEAQKELTEIERLSAKPNSAEEKR